MTMLKWTLSLTSWLIGWTTVAPLVTGCFLSAKHRNTPRRCLNPSQTDSKAQAWTTTFMRSRTKIGALFLNCNTRRHPAKANVLRSHRRATRQCNSQIMQSSLAYIIIKRSRMAEAAC